MRRAGVITQASGPMTERNKALACRFFEELSGTERAEPLSAFLTSDYLGNDPLRPETSLGRDEMLAVLTGYRRAARGLVFDVEDQLAEDDRVATRWAASASCLPDGRSVRGISVMRFLAGRQVECWTHLEAPSAVPRSLEGPGCSD